jgi:hypothetical protein
MLLRFIAIALFTFAPICLIVATSTQAQTLDEIFNPGVDYGNGDKPLTSKFMATRYYNGCIKSENITMTPQEKEFLCTCSAAKASQILLVDEFKVLNERTKAGRNARGKFLAYAYAPCMPYVMEKVLTSDCKKSKLVQDIVVGKNSICKCASNNYKHYIKTNKVTVLDKALHKYPRTLDPLEYYLRDKSYYSQRDIAINTCKYDFLYHRDN